MKFSDMVPFLLIGGVAFWYSNGQPTYSYAEPATILTTSCIGKEFFNNAGACLFPSSPIIGWIMIGVVLVYLGYRILKN